TVSEVDANADVTVVQIHGGSEYQQEPTDRIRRLTETAKTAGADVVVNHHPHVAGGVELQDETLIAWTLGNLVFDQEFWSTFPSYLLTVHVTADGIPRAYVDPLLIEGYVPKGVVDKPRTWQLRETAALSSDEFSLDHDRLEYIAKDEITTRTEPRTLDGDTIYTRNSGWVNRVIEGAESVELGRDLLPTGTFDDPDIDDERHEGPLWRFGRGDDSNGPEFGYDGSGGIQLSRTADNTERSVLTTAARVPLAGSTTLLGQYRHETDTRLELLVRWYESTSGSALDSVLIDLDRTTGWESLERSLSTPEEATHVRFYFRLYPPERNASPTLTTSSWSNGPIQRPAAAKTTITSVYTSPRPSSLHRVANQTRLSRGKLSINLPRHGTRVIPTNLCKKSIRCLTSASSRTTCTGTCKQGRRSARLRSTARPTGVTSIRLLIFNCPLSDGSRRDSLTSVHFFSQMYG
ncbi:CapA family protein, partial [Haloquadratum walsbyi]|uniref:CapA family protein n=1 Tax=Haloquadratum walsbyi TaxID=293091 RepID=UPI0023F36111